MKVYDVPWLLRAQPATERSPEMKGMRVVITLDARDYEVFRRLRDRVYDPVQQTVKLMGVELAEAQNEMHTFMELHYFADAHGLTQDEIIVKGLEDPSAPDTEAHAQLAEFATRFAVPESVLEASKLGQLRMGDPGALGPEAVPTPSGATATPVGVAGLADFDGVTYVRALDHERLGKQLLAVGRLMADGAWHTLSEISAATDHPEASVSARIRDLRKRKFGGHSVNRERMSSGLWRYKLVLVSHEVPWGDEEERQSA